MPIGYNTSSPNPTTKNTINSVTLGTYTGFNIRDFLLNKNLGVGTGGFYPQYSTAINGSPKIGEPVLDTMVGTGNVTQPYGLPLETEGILRWEIATVNNQYKDTSSIAGTLKSVDDINKMIIFPNSTAPNGINMYPETINEYGLNAKTVEGGYRKKATIKNLYLDVDKQVDAADWITLEVAPISQQLKGYLDTYGALNIGDSTAIQASSVIGSVLNGQGLGLAKGGVVTNFDLRSSLAGRVLSATGAINDTKLGMIGGQQLALALANNAAFNLQQDILGSLNVSDNILGLVKGNGLAGFRPNYSITIPGTTGGQVADYTSKILGFTIPRSYLGDNGSIFASENGNIENIARANSMLENTGKGQALALLANSNANIIGTTQYDNPSDTKFRSGYAPAYNIEGGQNGSITNGSIYAYHKEGVLINPLISSDGIIPDISYLREGKVEEAGFNNPESQFFIGYRNNKGYSDRKINDVGFAWGSEKGEALNGDSNYSELKGDKKSLLNKTQLLFNSKGMRNMISVKGDMGVLPSQIQTGINGGGMSHGSAVLSSKSYDTQTKRQVGTLSSATDTYCRSWTTLDRYDKISNLIRSRGLDKGLPHRFQMENSTLDKNGFPQIAPYIGDNAADPKKYMFSIENLAWYDNITDLLPVERGSGDLLTGKKGRIMWFPPYNIQFSESTNVNWEANNFIGRGESVYTYNNSERSGNLSFQIIVDHPSYVNNFRGSNGPEDNYVASFFAGCVDPTSSDADNITLTEISEVAKTEITKPQEVVIQTEVPPAKFNFYFPNDEPRVEVALGNLGGYIYESGLSAGTIDYTKKIDYNVYVKYTPPSDQTVRFSIGKHAGGVTSNTEWNDRFNLGLNGWWTPIELDGVQYSGFTDPTYLPALAKYLDEKCPHCVITVKSFASPQGKETSNDKLATQRTETMIAYLKKNLYNGKTEDFKNERIKRGNNEALKNTSCRKGSGKPIDTWYCKVDRRTEVSFSYVPALQQEEIKPVETVKESTDRTIKSEIKKRAYNEGKYFERLVEEDPFVFDRFRDKIRYFHPAFHSTTPEGLNSRLTFLNQCTRQGPTLEKAGADNLAFGRPPVCILRIGDFYNTKIIIDNIAIDYEPLVWDLNPEGIGVQPMIANVNISFKFIGGSTLMGPINKLQNALSFNYYANTHVYDPRADYVAKNTNKGKKIGDIIDNKDWMIVTGVTNINLYDGEIEVTPANIASNTPDVNEIATFESTLNGINAIENNLTTNDMDKISVQADVVVLEKIMIPDEANEVTLNIRVIFKLTPPLDNDHTFSYYLYDGQNNEISLGSNKLDKNQINNDNSEYEVFRTQYISLAFIFGTPPVGSEEATYKIKVVFDGDIGNFKWAEIKF